MLPLDGRGVARIAEKRPTVSAVRDEYVLYPHTQGVPAAAAPKILNVAFSIDAHVTIPASGASGVLLSMGGNDGGISFYVREGRLCYVHNYVAKQLTYVRSATTIPAGEHVLGMTFAPTGKPDLAHGRGAPGKVRLLLDGKEIGRGEIEFTSPLRLGQGAAMQVGRDGGAAVTPEYRAPFAWTAELRKVVVHVGGGSARDAATETRVALRKD